MKFAYQTMTWGGGVFGHPAGVTSVKDLYYISTGSTAKAVSDIAAAGYTGCELFDGDLMLFEESPNELRRLLEHNGMELVAVYSGGNLIFDEILGEELWRIERTAQTGSEFGAEHLVIGGGAKRAGGEAADDLDKLASALDRIQQLADRYDLTASFHPHLGTIVETPTALDLLMTKTSVALCPDTAHLAAGGGDPVAILEKHANRVRYVHLKDWSAQSTEFRPLGDGDLDLEGVVTALRAASYDGWVTVELDTYGGDPANAARRSAQHLETLLGPGALASPPA